jgi:hypothetical protein
MCCEGEDFLNQKNTRVGHHAASHVMSIEPVKPRELEEIFLFSRCVCLFIHTLREITRWPEEEEEGGE